MAPLRARGGRQTVRLRAPLPAVEVAGRAVRFPSPADLQVELEAGRTGITARVRVRGEGIAACDRCLGTVTVPVRLEYEERFQTPAQAAAAPAADEEERRATVYRGDVIDLTEGLRQQLILGLPFKLLCREDCRGLCPRCGRNLNEGDCGCSPEERGGEALRPLLERLVRKTGNGN